MSFFDVLTDVALPVVGMNKAIIGNLLGSGDAPSMAPPPTPPPPPDLTDAAVKAAALAQRRRLLAGGGLGSMFMSGPLGDTSAVSTSTASAGGL